MSDLSKIITRESAKLDRQDEAVRITRAHIKALEQMELDLETQGEISPATPSKTGK